MKHFLLLSLSFLSLSSYAQGLILSEDVDKLLPGPIVLKLGGEYDGRGLRHYSSAPRFHSPIQTENDATKAILDQLLKERKKDGEVSIACAGESKMLNGLVKIEKIDYCYRTSDGKILWKDPKISDADGLILKAKIRRVVDEDEDEKIVFAKQDPKAQEAQASSLSSVIDAAVSKCADGSKQEIQKMGRLNRQFNFTYIAKSNNQDFVTISPDGSVNLYYCAPKRIIYVNGRQKQESIPVDSYSFNLGNLKDRANCDFSDILSGTVSLRFKGSYYQTNITVRPILGTDAEKNEYKKLCINQDDPTSFRAKDSSSASAQ